MTLDRLLAPRSVAVVGASARPGSFGERLALEALRSPGVSRVHLVNPGYDTVQGRRCVPSLADLDESVDLVVLGVPDAQLADHLARARAHGAGGAVIYGSAAGRADALRAAADGLPLVGAGCMGFVNVTGGVRALGYLERAALPPGGIALVTHSGSMFSALLRTHRRLEYTLAVSSGQELVTTTGDYLQWALAQESTRVIGLFLETIRDADALRAGLSLAAERDVPVVALTVGGSPTGRTLVTAHSGAIAGDDAAWEALFATYGVHRTHDVEELVDTLELFAVGRRVLPTGGIATVHDSGAERVLVADVASDERVPFAPLTDATRTALAGVLDEGLTVGNPLDVWGRGSDTEVLFRGCLDALAADATVDTVALAIDLVEEYDGDEAYPHAIAATWAATDKPVVVLSTVAAAVDQEQAGPLRDLGIPVLEGARSGLRALRHLRDHALRPPTGAALDRVLPATLPDEWLDAAESLRLLASFGISTVPTYPAGSGAEALDAAESLRLAGGAQDRRARGRAPRPRRRGPGRARHARSSQRCVRRAGGRPRPARGRAAAGGRDRRGRPRTRARSAPRSAARAGHRRQPDRGARPAGGRAAADDRAALPRRWSPATQRRSGRSPPATSLPWSMRSWAWPGSRRRTATDWRRST